MEEQVRYFPVEVVSRGQTYNLEARLEEGRELLLDYEGVSLRCTSDFDSITLLDDEAIPPASMVLCSNGDVLFSSFIIDLPLEVIEGGGVVKVIVVRIEVTHEPEAGRHGFQVSWGKEVPENAIEGKFFSTEECLFAVIKALSPNGCLRCCLHCCYHELEPSNSSLDAVLCFHGLDPRERERILLGSYPSYKFRFGDITRQDGWRWVASFWSCPSFSQ